MTLPWWNLGFGLWLLKVMTIYFSMMKSSIRSLVVQSTCHDLSMMKSWIRYLGWQSKDLIMMKSWIRFLVLQSNDLIIMKSWIRSLVVQSYDLAIMKFWSKSLFAPIHDLIILKSRNTVSVCFKIFVEVICILVVNFLIYS